MIEVKCEKCGKAQIKTENKSNENWNHFKLNEKCDCGGLFLLHFNNKPIKKD